MYDREHPDRPAQDGREPIPAEPSRQDALGRLRRERWHAMQAKEYGRVRELDAEIARISALNTPVQPDRETTSAATPRRERGATPPRKRK